MAHAHGRARHLGSQPPAPSLSRRQDAKPSTSEGLLRLRDSPRRVTERGDLVAHAHCTSALNRQRLASLLIRHRDAKPSTSEKLVCPQDFPTAPSRCQLLPVFSLAKPGLNWFLSRRNVATLYAPTSCLSHSGCEAFAEKVREGERGGACARRYDFQPPAPSLSRHQDAKPSTPEELLRRRDPPPAPSHCQLPR